MASRKLYRSSLQNLLRPSTTSPRNAHLHRALQSSATSQQDIALSAQPSAPAVPSTSKDPLARDTSVPLVPNTAAPQKTLSIADRFLLTFRDSLPKTTEPYVAYDVTRALYHECASQAAYVDDQPLTPSAEFWYTACERPPTFTSWAQVTILHMWLLTVRMRALDASKLGIWQQHFIDHFFYDAEAKMAQRYGLTRSMERGNYMKDLYAQYRGMTAAYDEALCKGDAVMATAVWRNIFNGIESADIEKIALIVSHVRRIISKMEPISDDMVMKGLVAFALPTDEMGLVEKESRLLKTIAKEEAEKEATEKSKRKGTK